MEHYILATDLSRVPLQNKAYLEDKVRLMMQEAWEVLLGNTRETDKAASLAQESHRLATQCDDQVGVADSSILLSIVHMFRAEYNEAIEKAGLALNASLSSSYLYGQASAYSSFGSVYAALGEFNRAHFYYQRAIQMFEEQGVEDMRLGLAYYGMGQIFLDRVEPETALEWLEKSRNMYESQNLQIGLARTVNVIGNAYMLMGDYDKALDCAFNSLAIFANFQNGIGQSRTLHDLGRIYQKTGDRATALSYFKQALDLRLADNYRPGIITTYADLGHFYLEEGNFAEAEKNLRSAQEWCIQGQVLSKEAKIHRLLSELYHAQGKYEQSLEEFKRYHTTHEKAMIEDATNQTRYLQMVHEVEQKARENEMYRLQNIELAKVNQELGHALELINDSLNYARRIQNIILPAYQELKQCFCDAFVFYRPRDIVSGDFYWLHREGNMNYLAVVDCTGHGVPGAFMSLLGYSLLNHIIKERHLKRPSEILRALDEALMEVLRQRDDLSDIHDGMDVALLAIDLDSRMIHYAGANEPLYAFHDQVLIEYEPARFPLGGSTRIYGHKDFPAHSIKYYPDDTLYLFSDGFKDQFGLMNDQKRKYSSKRFRDMLKRICNQPMEDQSLLVEREFMAWKGSLRQTDDVLVIGIRL